jgi:phage-related protein
LVLGAGAGHDHGPESWRTKQLSRSRHGTASDVYPIGVTVTDNHNATATASTSVTVNNVAPTITGLAATSIFEMGATTLTGAIGDVGTLDTFTVFIDWGNGTQTFTGVTAGAFSYSRQYLDDNAADSYPITMTVTDDDTGTVTASTVVTVQNLDPTATGRSLRLATFIHAGTIAVMEGSYPRFVGCLAALALAFSRTKAIACFLAE